MVSGVGHEELCAVAFPFPSLNNVGLRLRSDVMSKGRSLSPPPSWARVRLGDCSTCRQLGLILQYIPSVGWKSM